jgi:hypothetical protein
MIYSPDGKLLYSAADVQANRVLTIDAGIRGIVFAHVVCDNLSIVQKIVL